MPETTSPRGERKYPTSNRCSTSLLCRQAKKPPSTGAASDLLRNRGNRVLTFSMRTIVGWSIVVFAEVRGSILVAHGRLWPMRLLYFAAVQQSPDQALRL